MTSNNQTTATPRGEQSTQSGQSPGFAAIQPIVDRVRRSDYWVVPHGGSPSHRRWQKLTDAVVLDHARNLHRVGACPMERGSSTTRLGLLDLDDHGKVLPWQTMADAARKLIDVARYGYGVTFTAFRSSGGHGIHLYAIWDEPQDARSVRKTLEGIVEGCGYKSGTQGVSEGRIEVFPKQPSVPEDGWGSMFILPLAGESVALGAETLEPIEADAAEWTRSNPVDFVEPPPPVVRTVADTPKLERVQSALGAIDPNELSYGGIAGQVGWLEILFAVHDATEGSPDGLALMHAWSSRWHGYDVHTSEAETEKQWNAARSRPGGITAGTLFHAARLAGWQDPAHVPNADGFVAIELDDDGYSPIYPAGSSGLFSCGEYRPEQTGLRGTISLIRGALVRGSADRIAWDEFNAEVVVRVDDGWEALADHHVVELRVALEEVGGFVSTDKTTTRDAIHSIAKRNRIDTGREWLKGLPAWDGVDRVSTFLVRYMDADDSPYTRGVGRYLWSALAGRIMNPGCQVDMVPVLVGAQGRGKTQSIKAMLPDRKFYGEIDLSKRDADQARLIRGKVIGELAELRGLRGRDHESIKAFITREHEEWTPKYFEANIQYKRRIVFIGTTNEGAFLVDHTGNRRWLPVNVDGCDVEAIRRDRDQLWAQALAIWSDGGVDYRDAAMLSSGQHRDFEDASAVEDALAARFRFEDDAERRDGQDKRRHTRDGILRQLTARPGIDLPPAILHGFKEAMFRLWKRAGATAGRGGVLYVSIGGEKVKVYAQGGKNCGWLLPPERAGDPVDGVL